MIPLITTASTNECYDKPETARVRVIVYCQECKSPLRSDDRCPKCDPPPLDYSDSWKV
jgi:hypothetical protein